MFFNNCIYLSTNFFDSWSLNKLSQQRVLYSYNFGYNVRDGKIILFCESNLYINEGYIP